MAVNYAMTGRAEDPYPTRANTMSAAYGGLGGQVSPSFGNTATPQFGSNTSGQRFGDLQSALANIGYQRSGVQRERAKTLDDLSRQFRETRRPIPGQFNRRGMLDSGQYQRAVGRTYEDELRRTGRYELGVQEALNALAAQQLGAEQQYAGGRLQDALNAAQAQAQQMATIPQGSFPALGPTTASSVGIPTLPATMPAVSPLTASPPAAPAAVATAPAVAPAVVPEAVPDLAAMAQTIDATPSAGPVNPPPFLDHDWDPNDPTGSIAWGKRMADQSLQREIDRTTALAAGKGGDYFLTGSTGEGSTSIAPTWLNPGGVASHVISVPWDGTGGPGDPAFQALLEDAAMRMSQNFVYDPNLHAFSGGGGGYTSDPATAARIRAELAEKIKEATG